jgi:hypothetical protein
VKHNIGVDDEPVAFLVGVLGVLGIAYPRQDRLESGKVIAQCATRKSTGDIVPDVSFAEDCKYMSIERCEVPWWGKQWEERHTSENLALGRLLQKLVLRQRNIGTSPLEDCDGRVRFGVQGESSDGGHVAVYGDTGLISTE